MKLGALEVRIRDAALLCAAIVFALLLLAAPAHAAFPGKNGKIAFDSGRDEPDPITCGSFGRHPCNAEIYTVNPDGTGLTRLTNNLGVDIEPTWSPDGNRIAFISNRDGICSGRNYCGDVFVMNADGSGQTNLTSLQSGYAYSPTWSPSGEVAFGYFDTDGAHFETVRPDGTNLTTLFTFPCPKSNEYDSFDCGEQHFAWSPDGQEIAFDAYVVHYAAASNTTIWTGTIKPDGTGAKTLRYDVIEPDWSPDSSEIVLRDEYGFDPDASIRAIDRSGNLVRNFNRFGGNPVWSPDGQQVAFVRYTGIFKMNADGSGETQVTSNTTDRRVAEGDVRPDWQPIPGPQRGDYKNAAQFCKAESDFMGDAAFTQKYGGGANAHGKCVSQSH
jgi:dipeptidyl aminopeptidase/acylaminoacyl peptidase